jgi:hypothetical protein
MILRDNNGTFFSIEAVLALIPIFIILLTISNLNMDYTYSYQEITLYHHAQDTLDMMSVGPNSGLDQISFANSNRQPEQATKIADHYLRKSMPNSKYRLVEMKNLQEDEICSNTDFKSVKHVAVAVKCHRDHIYKIYIAN